MSDKTEHVPIPSGGEENTQNQEEIDDKSEEVQQEDNQSDDLKEKVSPLPSPSCGQELEVSDSQETVEHVEGEEHPENEIPIQDSANDESEIAPSPSTGAEAPNETMTEEEQETDLTKHDEATKEASENSEEENEEVEETVEEEETEDILAHEENSIASENDNKEKTDRPSSAVNHILEPLPSPSSGIKVENTEEQVEGSLDKIEEIDQEQQLPVPSTGGNTEEQQPEQIKENLEEKEKGEKEHEIENEVIQEAKVLPAESESIVLSADSSTLQFKEAVTDDVEQPLNMKWTFGFNCQLPVINLYDGKRNGVVYASSHTAVIYDCEKHKQIILQGHMNTISSLACSKDKRWLVTSDRGEQACIIIWDTYTGIPVQTIFDVVNEKDDNGSFISSVDISFDAKYVAAIVESKNPQVFVWDWTVSGKPVVSVTLEAHFKGQKNLHFHPCDPFLLVSNSDSQTIFYAWKENGRMKYDAPSLNDGTFNRSVGLFTSSLFQIPPKDSCLTATSNGQIAVWSSTRAIQRKGILRSYRRRALKLIKVSSRSLTSLNQTESGMLVIGDHIGLIRFYDSHLHLLYELKSNKLTRICSISFDICDDHELKLLDTNNKLPEQSTIDRMPFLVATFIVSTANGQMFHFDPNGCKFTPVLTECCSPFDTIASAPTKSLLCIGSKSGLVKLWDYEQKKVITTRLFPKTNGVYSLCFNHDSSLLAVGLKSGQIHILDAISLIDEFNIRLSHQAITKMKFSQNSEYLATADAGFTVTVFASNEGLLKKDWKCIGRYKSHYDVINDIVFGVDQEAGTPRLLTLGNDRNLVEYDLLTTVDDILQLKSIHRIEQSALPLSLAWLPPVMTESFLITSNSQHKMKLYNAATKMCRYTFLAPMFGAPVSKIKVIPNLEGTEPSQNRLLCYATSSKIGVQMLPLDGSPHRSAAVIGHSCGISQIECSHDGKFIFAASQSNPAVHMWSINRSALESLANLGGEGLEPFYAMIEGGKDGDLVKEIENYFYYAQIKSQGEDTMEFRSASDYVQLDQIPNIMRALGFYPSEQEIEDMLNEIKFKEYVETSKYVSKINLPEFIKLYINHRPAYGLSVDQLAQAFKTLNSRMTGDCINRGYLLHVLQQLGEHLTYEEMAECLYSLLGKEVVEKIEVFEKDEQLLADQGTDGSTEITHPAHFLPEEISLGYFVNDLLGFNSSRGDAC